jgi:uncharacterized protein YgbK (DUF1537 family)
VRRIALVADDYTGAADAGVHALAAAPAATILPPGPEAAFPPRGAAIIDTESRELPAGAAGKLVLEAFSRCRREGFDFFFKKIDSTLRGNPGAEIAAALAGTGLPAALVCPAFPDLGRACLDGNLLVEGVPVQASEFGRDPFGPVADSRVAAVLAGQTGLAAVRLPLAVVRGDPGAARREADRLMGLGGGVLIADAQTGSDLDSLAELALGDRRLLPAGSGGLARAIFSRLGGGALPRPGPIRPPGRILAVMGSLNPAASRQIDFALASGAFLLAVVDPDPGKLEAGIGEAVRRAEGAGNQHLILKAGPFRPGLGGTAAAGALARAAKRLYGLGFCRTLFAAGGATSAGLCRAFAPSGIELAGEVLPGAVAGRFRGGEGEGVHFLSKAGGFGGASLLVDLLAAIA